MILDKALLLKCLGGAVALAGTGTTAVLGFSYLNTDSPESLLENSGLSCTFAENSNDCEITTFGNDKKINVKYGDGTTKVEGVGLSNISDSGSKIKVQKNVTEGGYNQNLKLTIEGGDINFTNSNGNTITKLEEFETYEIVKELFGKYYLSRKSTALEGKSKALGLPIEDSACKLPTTNNSPTICTLNAEKLKAINFDGKNGDLTIESGGTPEITLTITKVDSSDSIFGTSGYKFAFQSEKDITISSSNKIMKNTNTEFKIKETTSSGSAKTLSLEKAWTVTKLAEKVNIKCPVDNAASEKKCTIDNNKEISYKDSANSSDIKKLTTTSEVTEKITYEEDQSDYNQGFKFTVSADICPQSGSSETLTAGTYQIKEEGGKWYLVKKE